MILRKGGGLCRLSLVWQWLCRSCSEFNGKYIFKETGTSSTPVYVQEGTAARPNRMFLVISSSQVSLDPPRFALDTCMSVISPRSYVARALAGFWVNWVCGTRVTCALPVGLLANRECGRDKDLCLPKRQQASSSRGLLG